MSVRELLGILETRERQKEVFAMVHALRAAFMETKTVRVMNARALGRSLARLRADAGILQKEMAARLRVSPGYLAQCEAGTGQLGLVEMVLFIHHATRALKK